MKRILITGLWIIIAALLFSLVPTPKDAQAVPSFARQKGKSCTDCHTIWPRLLAAGREFKELGYTDVGETYPRIQEDNLDLLGYSSSPLSVSIINFPYSFQEFSDQKGAARSETHIPDEVALFFAGRMTPNIGGFVEPKWARDTGQLSLELVKLAGATRVGDNTLGIVLLKSDVAGADPYNTIRFTAYNTVNTPAIFSPTRAAGDLFQFASTENQGVVVNGKFFKNMIYAAVGMFRGDEFAANFNNDPADYFGRAAFEYAFTGESIASIGGFGYVGRQDYNHAGPGGLLDRTKLSRTGADFQWQTDSTPHMFEAVAVYMAGQDRNAWDGVGAFSNVKFTGYYAEVSYFYNRMYGVTVGYDHIRSSEDTSIDKKGPTVNVMYLPWLNTKLALEYSAFDHADGVKERDMNLLVHLYF